MLIGNPDTVYKKKVLNKMKTTPKQAYQTQISFGTLNEAVEYYLIEQGREEAEIRALF